MPNRFNNPEGRLVSRGVVEDKEKLTTFNLPLMQNFITGSRITEKTQLIIIIPGVEQTLARLSKFSDHTSAGRRDIQTKSGVDNLSAVPADVAQHVLTVQLPLIKQARGRKHRYKVVSISPTHLSLLHFWTENHWLPLPYYK